MFLQVAGKAPSVKIFSAPNTRASSAKPVSSISGRRKQKKMALSKFSLITLVLIIVALIIEIIAFATRGWSKGDGHGALVNVGITKYETGLWSQCQWWSVKSCYKTPGSAWLDAVRAFQCLGLICLIVALILFILVTWVKAFIERSFMRFIVMILCFAAGVIFLISIVIYGVKASDLHYSFALACIAMILSFAAGVMAFLSKRTVVHEP